MKLETTAGQLRAALTCVNGIIERYTLPILGCIRFEGGRIVATDLDREVSVSLPCVGEMQGSGVIDYRGLASLARHIEHDEVVQISESAGEAAITFNGSDYRMASLPVADFPAFDYPVGPCTMAGNLGLVEALRRVAFCISTEETRYYLNGIALLEGPSGPVVAATNGHRLAVMPLPAMPENATGRIIPRETVSWLLARKAEPTAVTFSEGEQRRSMFEFAGCTIASKLIDGTFPDIFRVMPRDPKPVFSVDRLEALKALRRLHAFGVASGMALEAVRLEGGASLSLSRSRNAAQAKENVSWHGEAPEKPFEVGFNASYLIDILSRLTGDVVTFAADGEMVGQPCLITSENDALRVVLMPMRV